MIVVSIKEQLMADMKVAMKAREEGKLALNVIRRQEHILSKQKLTADTWTKRRKNREQSRQKNKQNGKLKANGTTKIRHKTKRSRKETWGRRG